MDAVYRRQNGKDTWHWCRNCSGWPDSDYIEKPSKPYYGELCCECGAKARSGACDTGSPATRADAGERLSGADSVTP